MGGGQAGIVFCHHSAVRLIHTGYRLGLAGKIIFGSVVVVVVLAVGVQNALYVIAAVGILLELADFAQFPDTVYGEACTFQLDRRTVGAGGADNLAQFKAGFEDGILGQILAARNVLGFAAIGQSAVMVDFITKIALRKAQIVAVIGFDTRQGPADRYSRILVAIDIVGISTAVIGGQRQIRTGGLEGAVQFGVLTSQIEMTVSIHRHHNAGGALYKVIAAQIKIRKGENTVLNLGTGYKVVLGQNGQIAVVPTSIGQYRSVPDGGTAGIYDLGIVNGTGNPIGMLDVLRCVQVIYGPFDAGCAVRGGVGTLGGLVQIGLGQYDLTDDPVIGKLIVCRHTGVGILVVGKAGAVGGISAGGVLGLVIQRERNDFALGGAQQDAAGVLRADIRIVVAVGKMDDGTVIFPGDGKSVGTLPFYMAGGAGGGVVRPVAVITFRGPRFHQQEATFIALGIIEGPVGRGAGGIAAVVGDRVAAVAVANDGVLVVAAVGNIHLCHGVPFKHSELRIGGNYVAGLAVDFGNVDLQGPLIVAHDIGVGTVCRDGDGLMAAEAAVVRLEAVGNFHFVIRETN